MRGKRRPSKKRADNIRPTVVSQNEKEILLKSLSANEAGCFKKDRKTGKPLKKKLYII